MSTDETLRTLSDRLRRELRQIDRLAVERGGLSTGSGGLLGETGALSDDFWGVPDEIDGLSDENFVCPATDKQVATVDTPFSARGTPARVF